MAANGVTWKGIVALLLSLLSITAGSIGYTLSQVHSAVERHARRPHAGALAVDQFQRFESQFWRRFDKLESKVDRLAEQQ